MLCFFYVHKVMDGSERWGRAAIVSKWNLGVKSVHTSWGFEHGSSQGQLQKFKRNPD